MDVRRDVVVIGASAGGLQALQQLVARLPGDLAASVLVVVHLPPAAPSRLADILAKAGRLPATTATDGQRLAPGCIYTAVPNRHLLIGEHDLVRLSRGPRENRVRPAVDPLFRAAARWCGPRVIGVVLSGTLDDGAAGLAAIAERGGAVLVQSPQDARFDGMPKAALAAVPAAAALPAAQLAQVITEMVGQPVDPRIDDPNDALIWETEISAYGVSTAPQSGQPVGLGCPECGGGMSVVHTGNAVHYVCHTGHSYAPQTLLAARDDTVESALWTAISAMQEKCAVLTDLADRARLAGDHDGHHHHHAAAERVRHASELLRTQLLSDDRSPRLSR